MTQREFVHKCLMFWLENEVPQDPPGLDHGDCVRLAAHSTGSKRGNLEAVAVELDSYTPKVRKILELMIAEECL